MNAPEVIPTILTASGRFMDRFLQLNRLTPRPVTPTHKEIPQ